MCGILFYSDPCGINRERLEPRLTEALDFMKDRGPDQQRLEVGERFAYGHTRLSIIDLNDRASQPFWDPTHRFVLVFNGEIYNFRLLRDKLTREGCRFETDSDTEVLSQALICWGPKRTLADVRGMFSFVFLDTQTNRFIAARDHFGQKPLYYLQEGEKIVFASSVKSLKHLSSRCEPDLISYGIYLSASNKSGTRGQVDKERTFFEQIKVLPAGNYITGGDNGSTDTVEYFSPYELFDIDEYERQQSLSESEALAQLHDLFRQSVARHLVCDVPAGVSLSGGVDSSLVFWLAHQINHGQISTFTKISPGIEEIPMDVVPKLLKDRPADAYFVVQNSSEYLQGLQEFVLRTSYPSRWGSGPPMHNICKKARQNGVHVILGGDAVDEYFCGYGHYQNFFNSGDFSDLGELVNLETNSHFYNKEVAAAYLEREFSLRRRIEHRLSAVKNPSDRLIATTTLHDMTTFLQTCVLPHSDAYSMMASVELRNPMLDLDLVKFAVNMPGQLKTQVHSSGYYGKFLLRQLAEKEIGPYVQKKKEGTRNFSMAIGNEEYWDLGALRLNELFILPEKLCPRDIIRLINLEIFHTHNFLDGFDYSNIIRDVGRRALNYSD